MGRFDSKATASRREFGDRLRAAMARVGVTAPQLVYRVRREADTHLSLVTLGNMLAGEVGCYTGTLKALCVALGVSADELLGLPAPAPAAERKGEVA
jgi:hypothetical protein